MRPVLSISSSATASPSTLVVPTMLAAMTEEQLTDPRRRFHPPLPQPRRFAVRDRNASACSPCVPQRGVASCVRRHRDRADRDPAAARRTACSTDLAVARAGSPRSASTSRSWTTWATRCLSVSSARSWCAGRTSWRATGTSRPRPRPPGRRRLPHRRPGLPGRRGPLVPGRPRQGHDRDRRRERVLAPKSRTRSTCTPPCSKLRCTACPTLDGARRCTLPSCLARPVSADELDRALPATHRRLQAAPPHRAAHRAATEVGRGQDPQARIA